MFIPLFLGLLVGRVTFKGTRQSEFAQLVTYHLVGDVHGYVLLTVVHGNGQTDEIGQHHGTARPGFNRTFVLTGNRLFHFSLQVMVNKWTLLIERVIGYPLLFTTQHNHVLCALVVTGAVAFGQVTPWVEQDGDHP